jgi:hypothetical protein
MCRKVGVPRMVFWGCKDLFKAVVFNLGYVYPWGYVKFKKIYIIS